MAKIVLIERTNILKMRLERLFDDLGFTEVISYHDSVLPLNSFLSKITSFDVIVVDSDQFTEEFDLSLEFMNDIVKRNNSKFVVLTSKTDTNAITTFFKNGVDEVILKPFSDGLISEKLDSKKRNKHIKNTGLIKKTISGGKGMLVWCKDFEIGVEEIDHEHKDIIEHFEKLYGFMKKGLGHEYFPELIKFLGEYVESHFEHEERLQKEVGYTGYEAHKALHDEFKEQVNDIIAQYKEASITNSDLVKLNLFIKEWLSHHILVEDKKLGQFVIQSKKLEK